MKVVSFVDLWADELRSLLAPGVDLVMVRRDDMRARETELRDAEVVFTERFDASMATQCHALRLVLCPAAGTENIDRSAVGPSVTILNTAGPEIPMSEYVMGALVALRQNFFAADRHLREGDWTQGFKRDQEFVGELYDSNLALIGYGRCGREVARRSRAFGMRCRAVTMHPRSPRRDAELLEQLADLRDPGAVDALVGWADAVVICCELSDVTRGLIDARRLALMKASAALVNVARGPIVVEKDLYEALRDRRIAGAGIDVWYRYPKDGRERALPSDFPFHELDNAIMTPHSSAWTMAHKRRKLQYWSKILNDAAAAHARA